MSGPGKNQVFEWDADAAKVILAITESAKKVRELTKVARDHNKAIAEGKEVSQETQEATLKALTLELNQREKLRAKLKELRGEQDKNNDSMHIQQARILMLMYGIDDFITVANQGDWSAKSMAGGLAAAANNMSVLLATVNPWLAIVPSIIAGFAKMGVSAMSAGEDVDEAKKKIDEMMKLGQQMIQQANEIGMAAEDLAEEKRQQVERDAMNAQAKKINELLAAQDDVKNEPNEIVITNPETGEARYVDVTKDKDKRIANLQQQIDQAERERRNLTESGERLRAEYERKRAENERKKLTEEGIKSIGPMRDLMVSLADQLLQAEADPEAAKKIPLAGDSFEERMKALLQQFQINDKAIPGITSDLRREAEAKQTEEMLKPKPSPSDLRLKDLQEKKLQLEVQREEEELKSPTGKVPGFRQPYYDREFDKLERDRKQAELDKRAEDRHRQSMGVEEKMLLELERLRQIAEARPLPVGGANR